MADSIAPKAARLVADAIETIVEMPAAETQFAEKDRFVAHITPLIASQYAEVMGVLRDALDTAGDEHAHTCAMNKQTGSDSVVLDCDCWVSRAREIAGEA